MLSYQTIDSIADSFIPLLAAISLLLVCRSAIRMDWKLVQLKGLLLFSGLLLGYGSMLLDNYFGLWPTFGLDYSTHSAIALVLSVFLTLHTDKLRIIWPVLLLMYIFVMLYQRYHSLADIFSTMAFIAAVYLPINQFFASYHPVAKNQKQVGDA